MQGLGILSNYDRHDICYAKSVAATLAPTWMSLTVRLMLCSTLQSRSESSHRQTEGEYSNAFIERVKKGIDALTRTRSLQEQFRDYAINDMLAAADTYDKGTTQVLIAKPNRSQTQRRLWLAIVMGKVPQPASRPGKAVKCKA